MSELKPFYGIRVADATETVPDDCVIIETPYAFFNGIGKIIRCKSPLSSAMNAVIQLPKNERQLRALAAKLAADALLRDAIIKQMQKSNAKMLARLEQLGQEVEEYQQEILELDAKIEGLI